jgi:hypothetical protein
MIDSPFLEGGFETRITKSTARAKPMNGQSGSLDIETELTDRFEFKRRKNLKGTDRSLWIRESGPAEMADDELKAIR